MTRISRGMDEGARPVVRWSSEGAPEGLPRRYRRGRGSAFCRGQRRLTVVLRADTLPGASLD